MMHILYADTHYDGAHRDWIDSYAARSRHQITKIVMPGGDWRWRLHGGASHLANLFLSQREQLPPVEVVLINGMVSAPLFLAATRPFLSHVPVAMYFQENQLTYPANPGEDFLWQNAFVNVMSAYVADLVGFNSPYLQEDFLTALAQFVADRKDYPADIVERITAHATVLLRGINLKDRFGAPAQRPAPKAPLTLLWNHRWGYEKGIEDFAAAIRQLHAENLPFKLILAGDPWDHAALKAELLAELGERVILHGLLTGEDYVRALRQADIVVAASQIDSLGVAVLEGIYAGCFPVLPNRASFPTLLPNDQHDLLYGTTTEELIKRLRYLITHPEAAHRPHLSQIALPYDWSEVINIYDDRLEALAKDEI